MACLEKFETMSRGTLYGCHFAVAPLGPGAPVLKTEDSMGSMITTASAQDTTERCGPVVYLDFDGVLHNEEVLWSPKRGPYLKTPASYRLFQHVGLLESLLMPYPDVRIILSTSWVLRYGCLRTARRLPIGLRERVVGATFHSAMDSIDFQSLPRGLQVWADVLRRQPRDWLALDDDYMNWPAWCRDQYVRTDPLEGISHPSVLGAVREGLRRIAGPGIP